MPRVGLEPTQHFCQGSLNPSCLPIPPPGRGDPRRTRTFDPLVKSQLLYRLSYEVIMWLAWQDLNLRITGSKPVALPLGYRPMYMVEGEGFEPPNPKELVYSQPRLARLRYPSILFKITLCGFGLSNYIVKVNKKM